MKSQVDKSEMAVGFYEGLESIRENIQLPLGKPENDHNVTIIASVFDSLGATATVNCVVKVRSENFARACWVQC